MLKPKLLEIEGFRSFKDKVTIEFPEKGAILISGKYKDSTLSSGSGKSSILMAISFALGICKLPATELKNWDSKKISVRFTLTDGVNDFTIIRDPKLSLIIAGQAYDGLAKGAEEKLDEILQIKSDLAEILVSRAQRVSGKFINATDSAKKEFLTPLLKLDQLEKANDEISTNLSGVQSEILTANSTISALSEVLAQAVPTQADLEAAQKEVDSLKLQLASYAAQDISAIEQKIVKIEEELKKVQNARYAIRLASNENDNIKSVVMNLHKEIETLKGNLCPTCNREWSAAQATIDEKEIKKKALLDKFQQNLIVMKESNQFVETVPEAKLNEDRQAALAEMGQLKAPIATLSGALRSAEQNLNNISNSIQARKQTEQRLAVASQKIVELKERETVLEYSLQLIGRNGFLGSIFDEVLVEIESRSNEMLKQIPNVNTFVLSISSTSVTKSGTSKKNIATAIYKDGKEVSLKGLSGGQMCSLELCVDLAVRETICARSGTNLGWLALDEAMDGMDVDSKKAALDIVKTNVNGLVLIVDHSTEVKEGFEKVIEVEYDGRYSKVL